MARTSSKSTVSRTTVATVYDRKTGTYVAQRKDGSVTVGRFNQPGSNFYLPR